MSAGWEHGNMPSQEPENIARLIPPSVQANFDTVFNAVPISLDCDGNAGFVAQVRRAGSVSMVGYVDRSGKWDIVFQEPTPVAGSEIIVLGADLNGDRRLDLVTMGQDEGGYVPRIIASADRGYTVVPIPRTNVLRNEEGWASACLRHALPVLVGSNRIALRRETISPDSDRGHGTKCNLPQDTFALQGTRLVPVH